jgi:hypothetical protein
MGLGSSNYGGTELAGRLAGAGAVPPPIPVIPVGVAYFIFNLPEEVREAHTYKQPDPVVPFEDREAKAMPSAVIECTSFVKDPAATKPYCRNWSEILDAGETIVTSTWDGGGLTVVSSYILGEKCFAFLSGGVINTVYVVSDTITTSAGRTYVREIRIVVEYT